MVITPSPPQSPPSVAWPSSSHHPIRSQALVRLARPEGIALPAQMGSASCGLRGNLGSVTLCLSNNFFKCIYRVQRYIYRFIIHLYTFVYACICYVPNTGLFWTSGFATSEYFFRHFVILVTCLRHEMVGILDNPQTQIPPVCTTS